MSVQLTSQHHSEGLPSALAKCLNSEQNSPSGDFGSYSDPGFTTGLHPNKPTVDEKAPSTASLLSIHFIGCLAAVPKPTRGWDSKPQFSAVREDHTRHCQIWRKSKFLNLKSNFSQPHITLHIKLKQRKSNHGTSVAILV